MTSSCKQTAKTRFSGCNVCQCTRLSVAVFAIFISFACIFVAEKNELHIYKTQRYILKTSSYLIDTTLRTRLHACIKILTNMDCSSASILISKYMCVWGHINRIGAWVSKLYHVLYMDLIIHPCHNLYGGLAKPSLKSGHGWVITSHSFMRMLIIYPCPNLDASFTNLC